MRKVWTRRAERHSTPRPARCCFLPVLAGVVAFGISSSGIASGLGLRAALSSPEPSSQLVATASNSPHLPAATLSQTASPTKTGKVSADCTFNGKKLYGKVQIVEHFPDVKIRVVEHFPDLKVKVVEHFPDDCGKWKLVEHHPDLKVQFVKSFPDVEIEYVEHFPGLP